MNGRKARALRKQVYGDRTFRARSYTRQHAGNKTITDIIGKVHIIPMYTSHADNYRKTYQALKKSN